MTEQIYTNNKTAKKYVRTGEYRYILKEYVEPTTPELVPPEVESSVHYAQPLDVEQNDVKYRLIAIRKEAKKGDVILDADGRLYEMEYNAPNGPIVGGRFSVYAPWTEPKPEPRYFAQGRYVHDRTLGAGSYAPYVATTHELAQQLADTLNETENNNA